METIRISAAGYPIRWVIRSWQTNDCSWPLRGTDRPWGTPKDTLGLPSTVTERKVREKLIVFKVWRSQWILPQVRKKPRNFNLGQPPGLWKCIFVGKGNVVSNNIYKGSDFCSFFAGFIAKGLLLYDQWKLVCLSCFPLALNVFNFRLSHHEFLKRYSLALKYLDPATRSHMPPPQARSPKKADTSPRCTTVERLKRRSRRRHRSSYDHTKHICRSILEVVQLDSDESKENIQAKKCNGVKVGRTKIFLQEEAVSKH